MKKILIIFIMLASVQSSFAQREGRLGAFSGLYASYLMNANDFEWGDFLPTYKMSSGIEGSYFITVGRKVGVGLSGQIGVWNNGQNYRGAYADGSSYEAYARLQYVKTGLALNVSTNLRRRVAMRVFGGVNVGVLQNYQDRYEHYRVGDQRLILDINDQNVFYKDQQEEYGLLDEKIYEPIALSTFTGLGIDVKISDDWIFSLTGRFDLGMGQIENEEKNSITFTGDEARIIDYPFYPSAIKYHGPTQSNIIRQPTTNQSVGVFVGFCYRIYNRDRTDIWYVR